MQVSIRCGIADLGDFTLMLGEVMREFQSDAELLISVTQRVVSLAALGKFQSDAELLISVTSSCG